MLREPKEDIIDILGSKVMYGRGSRAANYERDRREEERFSLRQWCGRVTARRIGFFLCILGYTWALALFGMTINNEESAFFQTDRSHVPSPKEREMEEKTMDMMTILLQQMNHMVEEINKTNHDLLRRIRQLEKQIEDSADDATVGKDLSAKLDQQQQMIERVSNQMTGKEEQQPKVTKPSKSECDPTGEQNKAYTDCKEKMTYVERNWHSNNCYKQHGVDGSRCSIRRYMSEVEPFCPLMKDREKKSFQFEVKKPKDNERPLTNSDLSYADLIAILTKNGPKKKYEWMQKRIEDIWEGWSEAIQNLNLPRRKRKKVLFHLGLLTNTPGAKFHDAIKKGGPLGELVQWSDVITTLYLLGHDVTVISDVSDMLNFLSKTQLLYLPCKEPQNDKFYLDLIYTDIFGFKQIEERLEQGVFESNSRCIFRLVDSFGTEPMFNWAPYAKSQNADRYWGSCNVFPKQFFTLFPHSPDNSFMGFVVKQSQYKNYNYTQKKNQALVYGKKPSMWENKRDYINVVHSLGLEIHGTVYTGKPNSANPKIPNYVHNHGLLSTTDVRQILRDSKIFIGMGFPYEGPAPLEALAEGCVFFNAKFDPPHNSKNTEFFKAKPTHRKLTSQLPYLEDTGAPHVLTFNIQDTEEVKKAVNDALKAVETGKITRFIPREFTETGMLERLNAYIENQDFCGDPLPVWPPLSASEITVGKVGASCVETCRSKGLICEPAHFHSLNNVEALKKHFKDDCSSTGSSVNHLYPARHFQLKTCYMQDEKMLFSCAGESENLQRLCPCRTFIKDQSALCQNCL